MPVLRGSTTPTGSGGFVTPGMSKYGQFSGSGTSPTAPPQQEEFTEWDAWKNHFAIRPTSLGAFVERVDVGGRGKSFFERAAQQGPFGHLVEDRAQGRTADTARLEGLRAYRSQLQDRVRLKNIAKKAGVDPNDPVALAEMWQRAVSEAEAAASVTPGMTPWDVLDGWAKDGAPGTLKAEQTERERREAFFAEDPPDPYSITRTQKTINLTDPDTARALITQLLERELGRRPSDNEIRDFTSALNRKERESPSVTTTTENYAYDAEAGQVVQTGSESTTEGGAPAPAAFGETFVEEEHEGERDAFTAGVDYYQVMQSLVGSL